MSTGPWTTTLRTTVVGDSLLIIWLTCSLFLLSRSLFLSHRCLAVHLMKSCAFRKISFQTDSYHGYRQRSQNRSWSWMAPKRKEFSGNFRFIKFLIEFDLSSFSVRGDINWLIWYNTLFVVQHCCPKVFYWCRSLILILNSFRNWVPGHLVMKTVIFL